MTDNAAEWFSEWFDSPYYPLLYSHRDNEEAAVFISTLMRHLALPAGASVLDVACGAGRHALQLAKMGFDVVGVDLSAESIGRAQAANRTAGLEAHFEVADMRQLTFKAAFHCVLNLFTSFGYFSTADENALVLRNMHNALVSNGLLVIDFLNAANIKVHGPATINKNGVLFHIHKTISGGRVLKNISIEDGDKKFHFQERVRLLGLEDFEPMLQEAAFRISAVFGGYDLRAFEPGSADRLIIVAQKTNGVS